MSTTRDGIYPRDFSITAREGLIRFCNETFGDAEMLMSATPETWSWLWFRLREAPDRIDWFPRGRSATLQHIEQLLIECARSAMQDEAVKPSWTQK